MTLWIFAEVSVLEKRNKSRNGFDGLIYGQAKITVKPECLLDLLNVLLELGESYRNICSDENTASVDLAYPSALRAQKLCQDRYIEADVLLFYGVPYWFFGLIKRPGIIVGIIIAVALSFIGSNVLWDVRIEGNETLAETEIKEVLAEHDIRPGVWINKLDIGEIQTDIERENSEIAWISVNVIGTVAYVELVEERKPKAQNKPEGDGSNLVALRDGVIIGFEVIAGEPVAEIGQTVRAGELLVGGLIDSERAGYRAIESEGKVFALTEYVFEVEIPYEYTVKIPEKNEICEISMIFFSFRQKIFKKGGFLGSEYDTIYSDKYIYSKNGVTIPVGISVVMHPAFVENTLKRTPQEAVDLAFLEINRKILAELPEAEILKKSYFSEETADGSAYRLVCNIRCINDIACKVPFYINE